jgi:hypothetical protein
MMSHGASAEADSIRRTAQVCPASHSDQERPIARVEPSAHGVNAGPDGAGQGRQPATPGAREREP